MLTKRHIVVIDPTSFRGGSKVATENMLRLVNNGESKITIITADPHSWNLPLVTRVNLYQPRWLANRDQGIRYFLRHICIALNILWVRLKFGRFDTGLGASGPSVDLALYLLKPLLGLKLIQIIHGPVPCSRTIGRCLKRADEVHYLESSRDSLLASMSRLCPVPAPYIPAHFHIMQNGLSLHNWPTTCQRFYPSVFWAASLLKWKGLETLLSALARIAPELRPPTHICYIKPRNTQLPSSTAPVSLAKVHWYEKPINIDQIRAGSNIFISTSNNEPFGLSILEAMAAGLCVLIPRDGAYWDRVLQDNKDCIKYEPGNATDLAKKLLMLSKNMSRVIAIGSQAATIAIDYRAPKQYAHIKRSLTETPAKAQFKNTSRGQFND